MATERDIERLDGRIDKAQERDDQVHAELNKCMTEIKITVARIDERMLSAFGELEEGDTAFADLNKRLGVVEGQLDRWKGSIAVVIGIGTIALNFLFQGGKALYTYIITKGGSN